MRKKHGKRSIPIRKGDEVLVMRGSFKKKKAKVATIGLKRTRIALESIQRTKKDGTKVNVWFAPSSVQIITLSLDDKKRIAALERGKKPSESKSTTIHEPNSKGKVGKETDKVSLQEEKKNVPDKSTSK